MTVTIPTCLFIYKLQHNNNTWHGKCVSCDEYELNDWRDTMTGYALPSGAVVEIRQEICDDNDLVSPARMRPDDGSIYAKETWIAEADLLSRSRLYALTRNSTYITLNISPSIARIPLFVRRGGVSQPREYTVDIELLVSDISSVPDVTHYINDVECAPDLDEYERMMYAPPEQEIPIPVGAYLPIRVVQQGCESLGVYYIEYKYSDSHAARCQLYLVDAAALQVMPNALFVRSAANRSGEVLSNTIGRVVRVIS